MDELKEHPMIGQFVGMAFNDVLGMSGMSREMLDNFDLEKLEKEKDEEIFSHLDPETLQPKGDWNPLNGMDGIHAMERKVQKTAMKMLEALDQGESFVSAECVHENLFTGSVNMKAKGIGALSKLFMKFYVRMELGGYGYGDGEMPSVP